MKPNIVVILTDDLDATLGTLNHTPNINTLLRDAGMTFENALVTNSVCCPSRATLLRGQYTHSHRTYTNRPPFGGHEKFRTIGNDTSTVAVWLAQAGYATALMGKYMNGYPGNEPSYVPPGWSDWRVAAGGNMYGNYDYRLNENGRLHRYGNQPADYMTDVLRDRAVTFIRNNSAARRPFFLQIATFAPHGPATPALRHDSLFSELKAPRTTSYKEDDARIAARLDAQYRQRVRSMQAVDDMVVALIDVLRQTGTLDNTYIFFTSDNGFHLGQHGLRAGKQTAFEEDIRVPLFVRGPGIRPRAAATALVANIDLAPTFIALAGAAAPPFVEGRSLQPLFSGDHPASWRAAVLIESYDGNGPDRRRIRPRARAVNDEQKPRYIALRTSDMTYIEHRNGERELYDLVADRDQMRNIAKSRPELVEQLSNWARRLHNCAGAGCRSADRRQTGVPHGP